MGVIEFVFEVYAFKDKMKGIFTWLFYCYDTLLRHINECILLSNLLRKCALSVELSLKHYIIYSIASSTSVTSGIIYNVLEHTDERKK